MTQEEQLAWINSALVSSGKGEALSVEPLSVNVLSGVYAVKTGNETLYLKCNGVHELDVTAQLFEHFPGLLPEILGYDSKRKWLLMQSGGARLSESQSMESWCQSIEVLGKFHCNSRAVTISHLYENQHKPGTLFQAFNGLLQKTEWMDYWEVQDDILQKIVLCMPEIEGSIENVERLGLSNCICHGDAHPMNCLTSERGIKWFDWSEAQVANPIVDIGWFLTWLMPPREHLPIDVNEKLLNDIFKCYLAGMDVSCRNVDIYHIMQYALVCRMLHYHEKFYRAHDEKLYFVSYFSKLLCRVLRKEIG